MDFSTNYTVRTDMADEILTGLYGKKGKTDDGITFKSETKGKIRVEKMNVAHDFSCGNTKKTKGNYVTVTLDGIKSMTREEFEEGAQTVAEILEGMLPEENGLCLIVCLGNRNLVADAIGPLAAEKIIVSRHIKNHNSALFKSMGLGECGCIVTGVLGETGLEAAELAESAVEKLCPKAVIVIDALASRRLSRLVRTVQISDTGISPGSGVNNERSEISSKTLGVPVISIGVPTVVEAATVCMDILGERIGENREIIKTVENALNENPSGFFVTPKDADVYVRTMSKLIGFAVNKAMHKGMNFSEMEELLS